ncbi:MAG: helix-turn-helix transcriptional regulator [Candidatus Aminicenantes bacterium]|jgi:AraC-like DNA-binding protein
MTDFKLINYIVETILNLDDDELGMLTVFGITRRLNISKSLVYDLFKAKNITPALLLNNIKMSRAMVLLENKEISVKEVSQTMGFHSPDYFIRLFKLYSGTTPGRYRKYL